VTEHEYQKLSKTHTVFVVASLTVQPHIAATIKTLVILPKLWRNNRVVST